MKFYLTNFGKTNNISESFKYILSFIPRYSDHVFVDNIQDCDVIIFVNSVDYGFVFQPQELKNKPIIVIDVVEAQNRIDHYFVGFYSFRQPTNDGSEYNNIIVEHIKLHEWFKQHTNNIKLYFKREYDLNSPQLPVPTHPFDFPSHENELTYTIDSYEEFCNRPCDITYIWGMTWPTRAKLHGEIMKRYGRHETVCCYNELFDDFCYYSKKINQSRMIFLFYAQRLNEEDIDQPKPNAIRIPYYRMMEIFSKSKIIVTVWGHGRKCWRDSEASFDSVMALQDPGMHYAYPWINDVNCIYLPNKILDNGWDELDEFGAIEVMEYYLNRPEDLYRIYLAGKENWLNYRIDNYITKYIIPKIESVL